MSVEIPNPLVLSPTNVLPDGAATSTGQDDVIAKIEELRAATASPTLNTQELLAQILTELKIMNLYLYSLPQALNQGSDFAPQDEPEALRVDTAFT